MGPIAHSRHFNATVSGSSSLLRVLRHSQRSPDQALLLTHRTLPLTLNREMKGMCRFPLSLLRAPWLGCWSCHLYLNQRKGEILFACSSGLWKPLDPQETAVIKVKLCKGLSNRENWEDWVAWGGCICAMAQSVKVRGQLFRCHFCPSTVLVRWSLISAAMLQA